jgi:hypothetical protein
MSMPYCTILILKILLDCRLCAKFRDNKQRGTPKAVTAVRLEARELAQHDGPPCRLEESDPAGVIL